ncbi:nucleotide sugar dehydratase, partial [Rhodospirillales bacterium 47_12_T64]
GKIYVLDMGDPVKISDLARQVIRLAGFEPDREIKIEYTGLRPGEKLYEELFHETESMVSTNHTSLKLAAPRITDLELLSQSLNHLTKLIDERNRDEVIQQLRRLVPEYNGHQGEPESGQEADQKQEVNSASS